MAGADKNTPKAPKKNPKQATNLDVEQVSDHLTDHAAVMRRRNLVMLGVVLGLAVLFFVITIVKMSVE